MRHRLAISLLTALIAAPTFATELTEVAKVRWREAYAGFGSFSGLEVNADGTEFVVVSDKGFYATGALQRTDGHITGVTLLSNGPIPDPNGDPVKRFDIDAEGLTRTPDGMFWVSFEANHRVWGYSDFTSAAKETARVPNYAKLQNNSSLEALASDPEGRLYTTPERSGELTRPFPVYRYETGRWSEAFGIPRAGKFLVSGAEFGPDGKFYVLERHFSGLAFQTRIRRFSVTAEGLTNEETLLESPLGRYDNLEGIDVWRDDAGNIRVTCISDDNNGFFQHTEFVEFIVRD